MHFNYSWRRIIVLSSLTLLIAYLLLASNLVQAASSGGGLPYEDVLDKILKSFQGPVVRNLSIIAFIVTFAQMTFGGSDFPGLTKSLCYLSMVVALAANGTKIYSSLFGHGALIPQAKPISVPARN